MATTLRGLPSAALIARKTNFALPDWIALITNSSPEITFPARCARPIKFDNLWWLFKT